MRTNLKKVIGIILTFCFVFIPHKVYALGPLGWGIAGLASAFGISFGYEELINTITLIILGFFIFLASISGFLLNLSIEHLVIGMGELIRSPIGVNIETAWTIVRDLVNLTFIFGLLWIGIMLIIEGNSQKYKKAIISIVIGALLVNFSLFFSRVIVDVSNIAAKEVYETMIPPPTPTSGSAPLIDPRAFGISGAFFDAMGVLPIIAPSTTVEEETLANLLTGSNGLIYALGTAIFLTISAFVFFSGAFIIAVRFGLLVILMALSPIAFAAAVLPGVEKWAKRWWQLFLGEAFVAPAYLFMIYIVYMLIATPLSVSRDPGVASASTGTSPSLIMIFNESEMESGVAAVMFFLVITIGLVAALIIAKQVSGMGASFATKTAGKLSFGLMGATGRGTFGRWGNKTADDKNLLNLQNEQSFRGWRARRKLELANLAKTASYDPRAMKGFRSALEKQVGPVGDPKKGGYAGRLKEIQKKEEARAESYGEVDDSDPAVKRYKDAADASRKEVQRLKNQLADTAQADKSTRAELRTKIAQEEENLKNQEEAYRTEKRRRQTGSAEHNALLATAGEFLGEDQEELDKLQAQLVDATRDGNTLLRGQLEKEIENKKTEIKTMLKDRRSLMKDGDAGRAGFLESQGRLTSWITLRTRGENRTVGEKVRKHYNKKVKRNPEDERTDRIIDTLSKNNSKDT